MTNTHRPNVKLFSGRGQNPSPLLFNFANIWMLFGNNTPQGSQGWQELGKSGSNAAQKEKKSQPRWTWFRKDHPKINRFLKRFVETIPGGCLLFLSGRLLWLGRDFGALPRHRGHWMHSTEWPRHILRSFYTTCNKRLISTSLAMLPEILVVDNTSTLVLMLV